MMVGSHRKSGSKKEGKKRKKIPKQGEKNGKEERIDQLAEWSAYLNTYKEATLQFPAILHWFYCYLKCIKSGGDSSQSWRATGHFLNVHILDLIWLIELTRRNSNHLHYVNCSNYKVTHCKVFSSLQWYDNGECAQISWRVMFWLQILVSGFYSQIPLAYVHSLM